jgi:hypothetical protein
VNGYRVTCAAALMLAALACAAALPAFAAGAPDTTGVSLKRGEQWMSLRAGYAKGSGDAAPNGLLGGGFGYRRFVLDKWSVGGFVHYDLLGRFGNAADITVPITLEVVRHTRWGAAVYPYVGIGAGAFYHKRYRTSPGAAPVAPGVGDADPIVPSSHQTRAGWSGFTPGRFLTLGVTTPVRTRGLLGLDVRMATVDKLDADGTFAGPDGDRLKVDDLLARLKRASGADMPLLINETASKTQTIWSVKLDYSITY